MSWKDQDHCWLEKLEKVRTTTVLFALLKAKVIGTNDQEDGNISKFV